MPAFDNMLLAHLPDDEIQRITPYLEKVELSRGQVLNEPFERIEFIYFLESGLSSEVARNPSGKGIEVGCVGREGFTGLPLALGVDTSPHQSFMQSDGKAFRLAADDLERVRQANPEFARMLLRYVHVFLVQIASSTLADGRYGIEQRLARWLLMAHDRLNLELPLTHDFLGLMLGVRRPSVTDALHILEGKQLIRAERGLVTVKDRRGLEELAGDAYGVPEAEYQRVILDPLRSSQIQFPVRRSGS